MSLSAARCLSKLKCLQTNFISVSKITSMSFISKRSVYTSVTWRIPKNYYDVLSVPENASQKQIKEAFYKLATKYHPDKNQGNFSQKFMEIKEAYDVLSNESDRMKYDKNFSNEELSGSTNTKTYYENAKRKHTSVNNYTELFNVYIHVVKVPNNVLKLHINNLYLKLILHKLFQPIWIKVLKNFSFNVLMPLSTSNGFLVKFLVNFLDTCFVKIELTKLNVINGKVIRVKVNDGEKVLVINIPKEIKKDQSFILFYFVDDVNNK